MKMTNMRYRLFCCGDVNNHAYNCFAIIRHAQYAHQKKKRRFMRVKPCKFYL